MAEPDMDSILDDALDGFELDLEDVGMDTNETSNDISTTNNSTGDSTSSNTNTTTNNNSSNITSTDDNDDTIEQALNAVASGVDAVNEETANQFSDTDMQDFFKQLLETFNDLENNDNSGNNENSDASFDSALKNIMGSFFDPLSLREPIEIIVNKYPKWLNENKNKLKESEYLNYEKQYGVYLQAWNLIKENEKNNNPTGHKDEIMDLLLKTFSYGSLPSDVMDGMMPDELKFFADKMTQMEKEIEAEGENENEGKTNDNNNNGNNDGNNDNKKDNNNDDAFNMEECMKLFEQLIGQNENQQNNTQNNSSNNNNDSNNNNGSNKGSNNSSNNNNNNGNNGNGVNSNLEGFLPNLNEIPKLTPEEMQQFSNILGENGNDCTMM